MAPAAEDPAELLPTLLCGWEMPRTLVRSSRSTFLARTFLLGCLAVFLCGNISSASTCLRRHEEFTIMHWNVRVTETWADKCLPTMRVQGYTLKSWHDCAEGGQGGGVAVFALERLAHRVTLLEFPGCRAQLGDIHLDHRPYVIGCWYRPPAPVEIDTMRSFKTEGLLHAANAVGCVVLGDLNVHHFK